MWARSEEKISVLVATGVLIFWYDTATTRWSHRSSNGSTAIFVSPRKTRERLRKVDFPGVSSSRWSIADSRKYNQLTTIHSYPRFSASPACKASLTRFIARDAAANDMLADCCDCLFKQARVNNVQRLFDRWLSRLEWSLQISIRG